jgi:hypothetical protein
MSAFALFRISTIYRKIAGPVFNQNLLASSTLFTVEKLVPNNAQVRAIVWQLATGSETIVKFPVNDKSYSDVGDPSGWAGRLTNTRRGRVGLLGLAARWMPLFDH